MKKFFMMSLLALVTLVSQAQQNKLKVKDNWQVFPTNIRGVDFVGYRHFRDYKLLRKKTCKRFGNCRFTFWRY